jgi:predicted glycogen debranching enzyme
MPVAFDHNICHDLTQSLHYEWLETNGLGGYASGTIAGPRTRKYHGLLVAALAEPAGRFLLLADVEDSFSSDHHAYPLACHRYPGVYHPNGHEHLVSYSQDECPTFTYQAGPTLLRKQLMMLPGENTVLVRYEILKSSKPLSLHLNPLLAYRDHHSLKRQDSCIRTQVDPLPDGFDITPYDGMPPLHIRTSRPASFDAHPDWFHNFEYEREAERGYDHHEDLFCPGQLNIPLHQGQSVIVTASVSTLAPATEATWNHELARRRQERQSLHTLATKTPATLTDQLPDLLLAGRKFLIHAQGARPAIIAGYPWFDDWGRDTLISLPGLTFCSGNPEMGVAILKSVGEAERDGLIPNFFAANPDHHAYNAVDASLWYFHAVQHMLVATGDYQTVQKHFWPVMLRILTRFMEGTRNYIFMNAEGLLHTGNRDTQLTWMDAKVHGIPVTPRHGYAVDINALWYNAICFADELAVTFGTRPPWPAELARRCGAAFQSLFWMEDAASLADSSADGILDRSIRPNQILAVSLPHSPLTPHQQAAVVEKVRRELLTPFGLRTLSPRDPAYQGRYEGDQETRDAAYHQGTVWPWLIGHFGAAALRVAPDPQAARANLLQTFTPLIDYSLRHQGLSQVPEIFDGAPPQRPNGCFAQAWSVAELIRLLQL